MMNKTVKIAILALFWVASLGAMENVKKIKLSGKVKFNSNGNFSDRDDGRGAKELFKGAGLGKPKSARKMTKEASVAHYCTAQLFEIIGPDGRSYILKEIKENRTREVKRLERVGKSWRLAPYIGKIKDKLKINLPVAYVSYKDHKHETHVLSIMRKAKGKQLQELMEKFKRLSRCSSESDAKNHRMNAEAYYYLGAAMGKFYKKHARDSFSKKSDPRTLVHQDMHNGNIFYNKESHVVTLIDNERMAKNLHRDKSIAADLVRLFVVSPLYLKVSRSGFWKDDFRANAQEWYSIVIPSFFLGFIRQFEGDRAGLFKKVKKLLLKWWESDPKELRKERGDAKFWGVDRLFKEQLKTLEKQLIDGRKMALHVAASNSALSPILDRMLNVEGTTSIGKKDKDGNIPLHEAAYFGNLRNVKLLLKADRSLVGAKNYRGETPFFKANFNRDSDRSRYDLVIKELKKGIKGVASKIRKKPGQEHIWVTLSTRDKFITVWNTKTGERKRFWGDREFYNIYFKDDGKMLVAYSRSGKKTIWESKNVDINQWEQAAIKPHTNKNIIAVLNKDGGRVKVLDKRDATDVYDLFSPKGKKIDRIEFSKDGKRLYGFSKGDKIKTWNSSKNHFRKWK